MARSRNPFRRMSNLDILNGDDRPAKVRKPRWKNKEVLAGKRLARTARAADRKTEKLQRAYERCVSREDKIAALHALLPRVFSLIPEEDLREDSTEEKIIDRSRTRTNRGRRYGVGSSPTTASITTNAAGGIVWDDGGTGGGIGTQTISTIPLSTDGTTYYENQYREEPYHRPEEARQAQGGRVLIDTRHESWGGDELIYREYTDGYTEVSRVIHHTKRFSLREFMNKNQELLEGMHARYNPSIVPFVFVGIAGTTDKYTKLGTAEKSLVTKEHTPVGDIYLTGLFCKGSDCRDRDEARKLNRSERSRLNTAEIATLDAEGRMVFARPPQSIDHWQALIPLQASSRIYNCRLPGRLELRGGAASPGSNRVLGNASINGRVDWSKAENYLTRRPVFSLSPSQVNNSMASRLREVCAPYERPHLTRRVDIGNWNSMGSQAANGHIMEDMVTRSREEGDTLEVSLHQVKDPNHMLIDDFFRAYLDYINTACAKVPFKKELDIGFSREHTDNADGSTRIDITLDVDIDITGGIGISPSIIPRDSYASAASIFESLNPATGRKRTSEEDEDRERAGNKHIPRRALVTARQQSLTSRAITPLSRSLSFEIPVYSTSTTFSEPNHYRIDPAEVIRNLGEQKLDDLTCAVAIAVEGVTQEFATEFMDSVGNKILSLYFDDEKEASMRRNFGCAVDAYKNRFFFEGDDQSNHSQEFTETIDKQLSRCYSRMESIIELLELNRESRDRDMSIISLMPEVTSPSRLDERFSRRANHLVFKNENGQLAYYKLQLELGSGDNGCHRLVRFPKVFSDGIVIAPDKTFYVVTAEDLVRGRVLRSNEITYEQVLGELNHEPRSNANSRTARTDGGDGSNAGDGTIAPASSYEEFGFSDDIGDEERELIDLAMQNQGYSL